MLTTWLTLRQAQEALKSGRLDEALRLASQPDVQGHKRASEILQQVGRALLQRAQAQVKHGDTSNAWKDLARAEEAGVSDQTALRLRQELVQLSLAEIRQLLEAEEPGRAAEVIRALRAHSVEHSELKVLDDVAQGWILALELATRGELSQAVAVAERVHRLGTWRFKALEELQHTLGKRRHELEPLLSRLHQALEEARWREVISLADQVLTLAPQHTEARKARTRAWRAVEPATAIYQERPKDATPPPVEEAPRRMLLWVDGVGGYLVCFSSRVSVGQATPDANVDIPLYADISRLHLYLTRDGEGYVLEALRPVGVNNETIEKAPLRDGDRITLGGSCQIQFCQPVPVSGTARLEMVSGHRLPLSVNHVLLMAETCILGPTRESHVVVPDLLRPVVLFRRKEGLGVRCPGAFTVNGERNADRAALGPQATVAGDGFRFAVEPLGARVGRVKV